MGEESPGLAFDRVALHHGTTYKNCSTLCIVPTRGMIHHRVADRIERVMKPMNQKFHREFVQGDEVGKAYDGFLERVLANPDLSTWKYVLTLEDDNLPPPDALIRLLESIEDHKFDAVSGIYFTKGPYNMPMAYGDPVKYKTSGVLDFAPVDIREAMARGQVVEVNGIAMGCALWRMDLFREIPKPWFVTVADVIPDKGPMAFTQDLYFCKTAKERGKRFGVDLRVKVGHMDVTTGEVY